MREDGGVSRVWTPPRYQQEDVDGKSKEEEESQDLELDEGSDTAEGFGHETTSDGPSIEFSSVSSSEDSGPGDDPNQNGSSKRIRLQLRAVYSGFKEKIKHESDLVTEIV